MRNVVTLKENPEEKLLGDQIERALKLAQIDKLTKQIEKMTGHKCNCRARTERLNALHRNLKRLIGEVHGTNN